MLQIDCRRCRGDILLEWLKPEEITLTCIACGDTRTISNARREAEGIEPVERAEDGERKAKPSAAD
jgi:hypothetical protein